MKLRLELKLTQKLVMTPQLQQAIKLLQLSRLELSQVVAQELLENPMLEEAAADAEEEESSTENTESGETEKEEPGSEVEADPSELSSQWEEYISDIQREDREYENQSGFDEERPSYEQTLSRPQTLVEHLLWQLRLSSCEPQLQAIGRELIGNIDDDGYLRVTLEEVVDSQKCSKAEVEATLKLIQGFDPAGVGARDLRECLLIQVRQVGLAGSRVERVIENHLKDIEARRYANIAKALGVTFEEVLELVKIIQGFEPKPGRPFTPVEAQTIIPDIHLIKTGAGYRVVLNDDGMPKLRISSFYKKLLSNKKEAPEATRDYLENRFRSAIWLVKSIEQRNRTIKKVSESIVKFQKEFFDKGVEYLKPLVLRQVADDIEMHESTISRVTTQKYMHSPQGIFELKYFFNSSISRSAETGGDLSSVTVRDKIRRMIGAEDPARPLKDQELVERLRWEEIVIARRTVAKYRTELRIPPANRRKFSIPRNGNSG